MKKILLATKTDNDMTSWLRAWGAFTEPSMRGEVDVIRKPPIFTQWCNDWTYYTEPDVIYLHRPSTPEDFAIIERAKLMGVSLWVDLDDDLQNVPEDNPAYYIYRPKQVQECIEHAIKEADILSCGGSSHAKRLRKDYNREVFLIPNALDDRLLGLKKPWKYSNRIAWRGSKSHQTDLIFYREEISAALKSRVLRDDYDITFFGFNPYWFEWDGVPYKWVQEIPLVHEFYIALTSYNACFHLCPMINNEFNRVKSNLCWTDATLAGSVIFAPGYLPEYDRPGIWKYEGDEPSFEESLEQFLGADESILKDLHDISWDWIRDNILQSKVNLIRKEILRNL